MNDNLDCDACQFLLNPVHQILTTKRWAVGLGNNQAYFGRAYVTLRKHKNKLSELTDDDWNEFHAIVRKIEPAYKEALGAEPLNWGCFMNNAYRAYEPQPHVHWHIFPRYKQLMEWTTTTRYLVSFTTMPLHEWSATKQ
jgi:diadenosine tetraphosphate (Ap4A) HIT family hydrolase